jgi:hypothetical protein
MMRILAMLSVLAVTLPAVAHAGADEPGAAAALEEPGNEIRTVPGPVEKAPAFRLELAFGWASLVKDPDLGQGMGGGLFLAWGLNHRLGVELSVFVSANPYQGALSTYGQFLAGNITVGPIIQLTRPGSRFMATIDLGMGAYYIPLLLQESVWTFGISAGLTLGYRFARWFGIGIKARYHLFHLAGGEFRDLKSFQKVGVVDRFEMPGYMAFYF